MKIKPQDCCFLTYGKVLKEIVKITRVDKKEIYFKYLTGRNVKIGQGNMEFSIPKKSSWFKLDKVDEELAQVLYGL